MRNIYRYLVLVAVLVATQADSQENLNVELVSRFCETWTDPQGIIVRDNFAYIVGSQPGVGVLDISDPTDPRVVGVCQLTGWPQDAKLSGDILTIAKVNDGLSIVDVSDPRHPVELGHLGEIGDFTRVQFSDRVAFLASYDAGLAVINLDSIANPQLISCDTTYGRINDLQIAGDSLYLSTSQLNQLHILDISDPIAPNEVYTVDTDSIAHFIVEGDLVFCCRGGMNWAELVAFSISERRIIGRLAPFEGLFDIYCMGGYLFCASQSGGLTVVDKSDPAHLQVIREINTPQGDRVVAMAFENEMAYVMLRGASLWSLNIPDPAHIQQVGLVKFPYYVEDIIPFGRNAVIADKRNALRIWDLADPTHPIPSTELSIPVEPNDIRVMGNRVFVTGYGPLLSVVDLSNPNEGRVLGSSNMRGNGWEVDFKDGLAYIADIYSGLTILDPSFPENIIEVGLFPSENVVSVKVRGNYAYLANWYFNPTFRVVDISNPANPQEAAGVNVPGTAVSVALYEDYAYVASDGAGVYVLDISEPTHPVEVGRVDSLSSANYIEVHWGNLIVSQTSDGFSVFDLTTPEHPRLTGRYHTEGWAGRFTVVGGQQIYLSEANGAGIYDVSHALAANSSLPIQPYTLHMSPSYPNPFNSTTRIDYSTSGDAYPTRLMVFDPMGRRVADLIPAVYPPFNSPPASRGGKYSVVWDASGVPAGEYIVRLEAGNQQLSQRITLVK